VTNVTRIARLLVPSALAARVLAAALTAAVAFAAGATAQTAATPRLDTDTPIEISADALEVRQEAHIAVFRGNVDARQGNLRLHADSLTVHYRPEGGAGAANAISRIDAEGSVFVSSPRETAQGARGVYDVERSIITLTDDVVLTRGENVVRGRRLVMNLTTGQSRIEGGSPAVGTTGSDGRVHGIFVPQKSPK
jgi:lipopolysaccharide export system protein LptA